MLSIHIHIHFSRKKYYIFHLHLFQPVFILYAYKFSLFFSFFTIKKYLENSICFFLSRLQFDFSSHWCTRWLRFDSLDLWQSFSSPIVLLPIAAVALNVIVIAVLLSLFSFSHYCYQSPYQTQFSSLLIDQ